MQDERGKSNMPGEALSPVDVVVIGAGIAGLSAAVYGRRSGLSVRVFEKHIIPGGACTAWKRKGYVFDYCLEYFVGIKKGQGFYDMWKELGVIEKTEFAPIDSFGRYVDAEGQVFNLYTDYRKLQEHMLDIAPEDEKQIKKFCGAIRKSRHMRMIEWSSSLKGLAFFFRSLPALAIAKKWSTVSLYTWSQTLKNPLLRKAIPALIAWNDLPIYGPIMFFGLMSTGHIGYPLGGSLPVAFAIEERAKNLGAEFVYKAGVKRVLMEDGQAIGVELEDGRIQKAKYVVSACDARATFEDLLGGQISDPDYEALFKDRFVSPSMLQVSLGVENDPQWGLLDLPFKINLPTSHAVKPDNRERRRLRVYNFMHDKSMAPDEGSVILVKFTSDYDYWNNLRADKKKYRADKKRVLEETVVALDETFPGIGGRIKATDVATPTSCERYTNSWRGSAQGWLINGEWMKKLLVGKKLPKTFKGLNNFYLIGQWSQPGGGTPPAAKSGRDLIRRYCDVSRL